MNNDKINILQKRKNKGDITLLFISKILFWVRLRQELCVNGKAHSVDQVKTLILMYHVFL